MFGKSMLLLCCWAVVALVAAVSVSAAAPKAQNAAPEGPPLDDGGKDANGYTMFHGAPVPVRWPVVFAAVPPGLDMTNAALDGDKPKYLVNDTSLTYTWQFAPAPNQDPMPQPCTVAGLPNRDPCQRQVVEYTWDQPGDYPVLCTVKKGDDTLAVVRSTVKIVAGKSKDRAVRREFRDMRLDDWNRWVKAVTGLKAMRVWDHLANVHAATFSNKTAFIAGSNERTAAHASPSFLPWHRAFLRIAERLIQKYLRDGTMGMPYWDWTIDSNGGQLDMYPANHPNHEFLKQFKASKESPYPVFTDQYVGPNGDPAKNYSVPSGPFCAKSLVESACKSNWYLPDENGLGNILTRNLSAASVKIPTSKNIDALMGMKEYDTAPFGSSWPAPYEANGNKSFRGALEGWSRSDAGNIHNAVHLWIGGIMQNVQYSIQDPIFMLHHTNVERMFTLWQERNDCFDAESHRPRQQDLTTDLPGVSASRNGLRIPGQMYDDDLFPWITPTSESWTADGISSEYLYATPGEIPPETPAGTGNTGRRGSGCIGGPDASLGLPLALLASVVSFLLL